MFSFDQQSYVITVKLLKFLGENFTTLFSQTTFKKSGLFYWGSRTESVTNSNWTRLNSGCIKISCSSPLSFWWIIKDVYVPWLLWNVGDDGFPIDWLFMPFNRLNSSNKWWDYLPMTSNTNCYHVSPILIVDSLTHNLFHSHMETL